MTSPGVRLTATALRVLAVLLLAFDTAIHLAAPQPVLDASAELGLPAGLMPAVGIVEAVLVALYVLPRTAPLGALLWTGYLGGAVLAHVRVGNPLFTHVLFPVYVAALLWSPVWLREPRLRALLPIRTED